MPLFTMDLQDKGYRPATNLTVLNVGLIAAGQIQDSLNPFATIRTFIMSGFQHRGLPGDLCV
ncbi:hypothetical protein BK654_04230 [Pseudomonas brassicacearum]|nr:hypothetical protein BK653_20505 [Pseudomonas brassicacearum]ROM80949.1 hypothetical protein BK654_04230 [Pseudomonas brassicacearum]